MEDCHLWNNFGGQHRTVTVVYDQDGHQENSYAHLQIATLGLGTGTWRPIAEFQHNIGKEMQGDARRGSTMCAEVFRPFQRRFLGDRFAELSIRTRLGNEEKVNIALSVCPFQKFSAHELMTGQTCFAKLRISAAGYTRPTLKRTIKKGGGYLTFE